MAVLDALRRHATRFPCGIFFHGGVFDLLSGTEVRIPDNWERQLEQTSEYWYVDTQAVGVWRNDPLISQQARRREDYLKAMRPTMSVSFVQIGTAYLFSPAIASL